MEHPSYIDAYKKGVLEQRSADALRRLENCMICPRRCGCNRLRNEMGYCRTGRHPIVCSFFSHYGEEPPISGERGSGAIFFSRCNLGCLYCQNYQFSQKEEGRPMSSRELADCMLSLQKEGCHNINLVTPTHVMPQILEALVLAAADGLKIPLVYNSSGYELKSTLELLEGIADIYLADMRYARSDSARTYSNAADYPQVNREAVKEMFRQVGVARFDNEGIIRKGLIIRHLVLPEDTGGTEAILRFIAEEISPQTYVSLMSQYFPAYLAHQHPPLDRHLRLEEFEQAIAYLKKFGLDNGWIQESGGLQRFAGTHIKRNV
ncbi:MAG: radical SAM protein [Candidatus Omnitrophica bacterium]|nr:radical SAM protein [Candidatus Omnitrophota bacterium]MDD5573858.1 radical SAM protein [Candidatus Omnitrophota bacterium]